ncbi:hypothetical protein J2T07_000394 [Luteibacter jiangsuensis]|uniref:Uncharacterized protein n=1 Tax=Luteibacter jiangsuensis TaxID=637577 RepID=A0ABT9STC2_9GAMM|nr:hypothetical protein [Luteibacter jiangsuensis]MDQ0008235.1 hypothetical protein [Luteibacter jiangsuensis]
MRPEQVAFLGEYASIGKDRHVFVQVMCWPTVPMAWTALTQAVANLREVRGDMMALCIPVKGGTSWVHEIAPQLALPLERDPGAAESTLAALIRRLPVRFSVAVVEHEARGAKGGDASRHRSLFSGCLAAYSAYLKSTKQASCRLVIAADKGHPQNDSQQQAYRDLLPYLDSASQFGALDLTHWTETTVPLALEMSQLAAAAVGRHVQQPNEPSPLFETILEHLVPPSRFDALGRQKRRK